MLKHFNKNTFVIFGLSLLLVGVSILSACIGAVEISGHQLWLALKTYFLSGFSTDFSTQQEIVLFNIRMPRILMGILVGATLSISGAAMQGLFRNPLADPGLIGVSSGAMFFSALFIVLKVNFLTFLQLQLGHYTLSVVAFAGACITTFIVYRMSVRGGKTDISSLLLGGIAINALTGSLTGLLTYMADDEELRTITFWSLGSLGGSSWATVARLLPFVILPLSFLPFLGKALNALALGESQALYMGVNVPRLKRAIIVLVAIGVGASVSVSGLIGFVGLVTPHIIRRGISSDNRLLIPASALLGAILLVLADLVSRTIVIPSELPIGIVTGIVGAPFFIYLIMAERSKRKLL